MALGSNHRRARSALALVFSTVLLVGCGTDEDAEPAGSASPSATDGTGTTEPTAEPSAAETTPAIEPATGIKLKQNHAEIRMPEGWKRKDNFGIPFLRQGASTSLFGALTWNELNDAGTDPVATSLDAIAKRQLRLVEDPGVKRLDDVVIGGDTMAYRLAGRANKYYYDEYIGVLMGNLEYSMHFSFNTEYGTRDEAIATIESMLATWDFNP
jgi:hypothetical protein